MFDHLEAIRAELRLGKDIDYNGLTSAEKQAAQALVESDEARLKDIKGRTKLVRHKPSAVLQFLTMGAYA